MAKLESKQTDLWVVLFVTFAAATIITILRLLSRRLKRIPLSWDDYFALCGYAISVGWIIIVPYSANSRVEDSLCLPDGLRVLGCWSSALLNRPNSMSK
ncbi:hypothetical protein Forpe1208_v002062 [Fusarium oxysporum f. sp. rapae]|uniref:Uncharacterized protein n=1 Tax=Fusarium oxysporum f. sp. rapae TaxID=485398 RepID=A0A8J5PJD2_FUSOX|nr:hypothetical protein Forpe1208_v002062 [Fusarium oxysporum f. sp. rapae]